MTNQRRGDTDVQDERRAQTKLAGALPRKVTDQMQASQRPFSQFASVSGEPAWKTIPSWYVVATEDHAILPATQTVHGPARQRNHLRGQSITHPHDFATFCHHQSHPRRPPSGRMISTQNGLPAGAPGRPGEPRNRLTERTVLT
jgi:hypothetical protein